MEATNQIVKRKRETFSQAITGNALQNLIRKSVADEKAAARFTGALISTVAENTALQRVIPASIVACALKGEGNGLQVGRDYYIVPYGDKAKYIVGYKGLMSLLLATGEVADANCIPVYEGEYIGRNRKTKRPEFDFSVYESEEEEEKHELLGYYFYIEKLNGTIQSEYMTIDKILKHAERYSKTFSLEKYKKIENGELTGYELKKAKESSPWYGQTEMMMKKTVVRKLLNSGFVRLSNDASLRDVLEQEREEEIMEIGLPIDSAKTEEDFDSGEAEKQAEKKEEKPAPKKQTKKEETKKTTEKAVDAEITETFAEDFFAQ